MFVQSFCSVMWICGCFAASVNDVEYETNCGENYDNEISLDQEDSPSLDRCRDDAPRWDKLFTALEDSHMRQNMLLSSVEQVCGGGVAPVKMLWDKLTKGCAANVERICNAQAEQIHSKTQREFVNVMSYNADMERNLNLTLQHILHQSHQTNARLKRLEDSPKISPHPTLVTRAYGTTTLKEQEVENQWLDKGSIGKTLVTIATELQRIQVQLSEVIEETRRKDKGDT
ncbi:hypothetical protein WMY93_016676 [Mugilogobius chulae]|uniref:Uncharacterized protein n=1 Tax=Mugilogobius chulae TaxID=88201 RepID=A0AAW0NY87_9GOBI